MAFAGGGHLACRVNSQGLPQMESAIAFAPSTFAQRTFAEGL